MEEKSTSAGLSSGSPDAEDADSGEAMAFNICTTADSNSYICSLRSTTYVVYGKGKIWVEDLIELVVKWQKSSTVLLYCGLQIFFFFYTTT